MNNDWVEYTSPEEYSIRIEERKNGVMIYSTTGKALWVPQSQLTNVGSTLLNYCHFGKLEPEEEQQNKYKHDVDMKPAKRLYVERLTPEAEGWIEIIAGERCYLQVSQKVSTVHVGERYRTDGTITFIVTGEEK